MANLPYLSYSGPSIGFGGNDIIFTADCMIYSLATFGKMKVEIGFLQALQESKAVGSYQCTDGRKRCIECRQNFLPVRDGSPDDIWFKTDTEALKNYEIVQALASDNRFRITAKDEVRAVFPSVFRFKNPQEELSISKFVLHRKFITYVAVRVTPSAATPQYFYLDHVTWTGSYEGKLKAPSRFWQPPPESIHFYSVSTVEKTTFPSPSVKPLHIDVSSHSSIANQNERIIIT